MRVLTVLLALACSAAFADQATAPASAVVHIVSPAAGARVKSPATADLTLPLPVSDGIRHFGKGQTETTLDLPPGKHTLQLLFADFTHTPFTPNVASKKITITVTK